MKNQFAWASALALAIGAASQLETTATYTNANGTIITNGTIIITTRAAGDGHFFRQSSSTVDDMDDNRGPGCTPGDAAMGELLMDNGYSVRLLPDRVLRYDAYPSGACLDVYGGNNNPQLYYDGHPGPADSGLEYNELLSAMLVVVSGSGSSADVASPNTNGVPIVCGEIMVLGGSDSGVPTSHSELFFYSHKTTSNLTDPVANGLYMRVVNPNHPIMQGIPLDAQGRVKIFRDPYPNENAHVLTPGGLPNYQISWTCADISSGNSVRAPGLNILGVLDSATNQVVFAVLDRGGGLADTTHDSLSPWYNKTTVPARMVHIFVNEQGSSNSRRCFNALSAWGRILFVRACQWAMGEPLQPYPALGVVDIPPPTSARFTNSIGMSFVRIPAGTFTMGYWQSAKLPDELILNLGQWFPDYGDYDEQPAHPVTITRPFYLGTYEVSNAEYEQYAPSHRALRGKLGFSTNDNEAVVFVSWPEAKAYCDWLSARDGQSYRLPTEAEWEFACRAGTTTHFWTGDSLPAQYQKNPSDCWYPDPNRSGPTNIVPLTVGQTPPNPWGLYDMHGNVEEWCNDWYGPYVAGAQSDPVGRADALSRVTRGGSHSTFAFHLRSENRAAALPEDRSWYIGFRVALADMPATAPLPAEPPEPYQTNVSQTIPPDIDHGPDPLVPFFSGPVRYVNVPTFAVGPVYSNHNHDPSIAQCPNGDLLAIWYTTWSETGRELALAASRLRYGQTNWEFASSLYDIPDRNDHAPALYTDTNGTIYHFNGISAAATWGPLAIVSRFTTNSGASWSKPLLILPEHDVRHQMIPSVFRTRSGAVVLTADAASPGNGGTAVIISRDGMVTWTDPGAGRPIPAFLDGGTGAWIAGIHANVTELADGRWLALGRGDTINGMMPQSVSYDQGTNWTYSASGFQPIGSNQRLKLLRLKEGPLFFAAFCVNMPITDASGGTRAVSGLFGAISYDDGVTWPLRRLISDDGPGRSIETIDGELITLSFSNAEPKGYLDGLQARNGVIHLISSRQHYQFNLKWLTTRPPSTPVSP